MVCAAVSNVFVFIHRCTALAVGSVTSICLSLSPWSGFTPNPDLFCNKEIKFKAFYQYIREQGFDAMATGTRTVLHQLILNVAKGLHPLPASRSSCSC